MCAVKEAGDMAQLCKHENLNPTFMQKSDIVVDACNASTGKRSFPGVCWQKKDLTESMNSKSGERSCVKNKAESK